MFFLTTNYANFTNLYCAQQIIRLIRAIRGFNFIRVIRCLDGAVARGAAGVDHEACSLSGHREVTGVDTVVLRELD